MVLSEYHQRHANRPEEQIALRIAAKKVELEDILRQVGITFAPSVRIAVLGCASKQIALGHLKIFAELFGESVEVTTFDITIEHLQGVPGVVEHDCTKPLPGGSYDITYGHVLLKFMFSDKQWQVLKNSYNALTPRGIVVHIMDKDGQVRATEMMQDGVVNVPLAQHTKQLEERNISYKILSIKIGPKQEGEGTCLVLLK